MNWRKSARELLRGVRACTPVPGAFFDFDGEQIKCWAAEIADGQSGTVGTVISAGRDGIDVVCRDGVLRMLELQRPGRGRISAGEFTDQTSIMGRRLD